MTQTPDRRGVLKLLAGAFGAAVAALTTVPVLGSALTPLLRKAEEKGGFLPAGKVDELLPNVPKRVELTSVVTDGWSRQVGVVGACWVMKNEKGDVSALSSVCPHSGCSIKLENEKAYSCPCHASLFSFDGTPTTGPSPRAMDPLPVELKDGRVFVQWKRFKIGVKEREES
jgi:menaquinol-cytochrome c reductase iron-sulfur subunit